jgi:hypothetical protein
VVLVLILKTAPSIIGIIFSAWTTQDDRRQPSINRCFHHHPSFPVSFYIIFYRFRSFSFVSHGFSSLSQLGWSSWSSLVALITKGRITSPNLIFFLKLFQVLIALIVGNPNMQFASKKIKN